MVCHLAIDCGQSYSNRAWNCADISWNKKYFRINKCKEMNIPVMEDSSKDEDLLSVFRRIKRETR